MVADANRALNTVSIGDHFEFEKIHQLAFGISTKIDLNVNLKSDFFHLKDVMSQNRNRGTFNYHELQPFVWKMSTFFQVNRVEHQKLNQTTPYVRHNLVEFLLFNSAFVRNS